MASDESKKVQWSPRPRLLAPTFLLAATFQRDSSTNGSSPARGAEDFPTLSQQITPSASQPSQQQQQQPANEGTPLIGSYDSIGSPFRQGIWSTWGLSAGVGNVESPGSNNGMSSMGNVEAGLSGITSPSSLEDRRTYFVWINGWVWGLIMVLRMYV